MRRAKYLPTLAAVFVALRAHVAFADTGAASLEGTLQTLFEVGPGFRVPDTQTREADALRIGSAGAFDTVATAGVRVQRQLYPTPLGVPSEIGYEDAVADATLSTRTRENVSVQIGGSLPFAANIMSAANPDLAQATAKLSIPLTKLGAAASYGANERASALHARAAAALQQDTESELAAEAIEGYWRWVGSAEEAKVARRLEALAIDQLSDVDKLVAQRARAEVERLPFAAARQNAAASRAEADQAVLAARQSLAETIGAPTPPDAAAPSDELPLVPGDPPDAATIAARAHRAAERRPLAAYLRDEIDTAAVRAEAADIDVRPDVNLVGQGSAARVWNIDGTGPATVGYYGMVGLQFALPLQNRAARGARDYAAGVLAEQKLTAEQQWNGVLARIDSLSHAIAALAATYRDRANAAATFEAEYEAERTRFRLGTVTALDVVVAEQQFMTASVAVVRERTAYAVALVRLLHETGALCTPAHQRDAAGVARSLALSSL